MARMMQVDTINDTMMQQSQPPEEFKAHYEVVNGKKTLVIKANAKTIVKPDGSKDVVISAPSLGLINKFQEEN